MLFICMCICIHVYMYTRMYMYTCSCIYFYTDTHTHKHTYIHIICIYIFMNIRIYTHIGLHIYIYTDIYLYIHVLYTCIQIFRCHVNVLRFMYICIAKQHHSKSKSKILFLSGISVRICMYVCKDRRIHLYTCTYSCYSEGNGAPELFVVP